LAQRQSGAAPTDAAAKSRAPDAARARATKDAAVAAVTTPIALNDRRRPIPVAQGSPPSRAGASPHRYRHVTNINMPGRYLEPLLVPVPTRFDVVREGLRISAQLFQRRPLRLRNVGGNFE